MGEPELARGHVVVAPMAGTAGRCPLIVLGPAVGGGWWVARVTASAREGYAPVPMWEAGGFVRAQWLRGAPLRVDAVKVHKRLGELPPGAMALISNALDVNRAGRRQVQR